MKPVHNPPGHHPPGHHPADDTLLRHAAGDLPSGHALVTATHLPFCPACRAATRLGEAVGGALLAELPPTDMAPDTLSRLLSRLDAPASVIRRREEPIALAAGVPLPACLAGLVRPVWRWIAPGVSRIVVAAPGATAHERIFLLRVAPGSRLPDHGHSGWEAACVLSGSFTDVTGEYGPGDVAELDGDVLHEPVAGAGEPCICLIAWEGPLRLRGLLARIVQPLVGV
jgi:putative transcriptional regulator